MSMNKKGFTLIESIITFAILAIAGTMFLFGFTNVVNIMSEGSLIKTETNELYNSLVKDDQNINHENDKSMKITFSNGKEEIIPVDIKYVQNEVASSETFPIKLSLFVAHELANKLPNELQPPTDNPDKMVKGNFYILNDILNLPVNYNDILNIPKHQWGSSKNPEFYFFTSIDNSVNANFEGEFEFGDVEKYIKIKPDVSKCNISMYPDYNTVYIYSSDYYNYLKVDNDDKLEKWHIVYFGIDKDTASTNTYNVYGYLVHKKHPLLIFNDGSKKVYIDTDEDDQLEKYLNQYIGEKIILNGKEYTINKDLIDDDFYEDTFKDVYVINGELEKSS